MLSFYLDTSSLRIRLCLSNGMDFFTMIEAPQQINHSEYLLAAIDDFLQAAHVEKHQLEEIIVHRGPGSFTGIRVGITTANALGYAMEIPVIGITGFELFAQEIACDAPTFLFLIPGVKDMRYAGIFKNVNGIRTLNKTFSAPLPEILETYQSLLPIIKQEACVIDYAKRIPEISQELAKKSVSLTNLARRQITPFYGADAHITKFS